MEGLFLSILKETKLGCNTNQVWKKKKRTEKKNNIKIIKQLLYYSYYSSLLFLSCFQIFSNIFFTLRSDLISDKIGICIAFGSYIDCGCNG